MDTIISIIRRNIETGPERPVFKYKDKGLFRDITWRELGTTVDLIAYCLLELGVKINDRIAILSENRPEWAYADLASLSCGAITVPIYSTNTAKDVEYILKDSGAQIIFVSTREQLEKVLSVAANTDIRRIISFSHAPNVDPLVIILDKFIERGKKKEPLYSKMLQERIKALRADNVVTIIYTSGATGQPKGVMLTNSNFVSNCLSTSGVMKIDKADRYLSFLPLSHVFERIAGYYLFLIKGGQVTYAESRNTVISDARIVSPTMICGVPRFFEKVYGEILNKVVAGPSIKKNLFFWAYKVGKACLYRKIRKKRIPFYLALQKFFVTRPVSRNLKKLFGDRLRFFVSGGAPLSKEVAYFFLSFDMLILEGYGLTESSPVITVNAPEDYKVGTVGRPIPGVEVRIAPDGEILAKGPNIMKGYYRMYEHTESAVKDGWLYTGDIGYLDKDGFLVITDRKKDIIITSGGKNIAPSAIETLIKADRYIQDALVYGDKRKFLSAIIVPDFENLKRYAAFKKLEFRDTKDMVLDEKIRDFIRRRIDAKLKDTPRFAQVKKFIILDKELTQDKGELTPTLKIKRRVVIEKYMNLLDKLYEE